MGAQSKIEWTDASWNPIRARHTAFGSDGRKVGWFCTHVSEGCRNCYAETINRRLGTGIDYKAQLRDQVEIFLDEKMLTAPLRWKKPRKIFVGSMTDLFGDFVPDEFIDRMFAVMALCPQHTFQILTKRPERMRQWFDRYNVAHDHNCADLVADEAATLLGRKGAKGPARYGQDKSPGWPLPNVWLGTSCEDQATADERIPHLLATPAAIRFLSCEPLLGPVDLRRVSAIRGGLRVRPLRPIVEIDGQGPHLGPHIDWVICGGESGPHARPIHPDWARSLRDQCAAAEVPYFFKQWGEWIEVDGPRCRSVSADRKTTDIYLNADGTRADGTRRSAYVQSVMSRVGKTKAGRQLDGRTHDEFPAPA